MSFTQRWRHRTFVISIGAGASAVGGCDSSVGPELAVHPTSDTLYVDATTGDDSGSDGQTPGAAYRTIGRAVEAIPSVLEGHWTIIVAPGDYTESVRLDRFQMPTSLSQYQIRAATMGAYIAVLGSTGDPDDVVLRAPARNEPCVSARSVILFLDSITCRSRRYHGLEVSGGTLVLDDVRLIAADTSASAVHAERSTVFMGGTLDVQGNFSAGLALRTYSLARPGTRRNRLFLDATFDGVRTGIFLRDYGDFTSYTGDGANDQYALHFQNVQYILYDLFGSSVFFGSGVRVTGKNIATAFHVGHNSAFNASAITLENVSLLIRCRKLSHVVLEHVELTSVALLEDTDGSCHVAY